MNQKGKNYLTYAGLALTLYFTVLSIFGAHERHQKAIESGQDLAGAISPGWYVLIFIFGSLFAALLAWYFISRKNTLSWKDVFGRGKEQLVTALSWAGGGVAALLIGALAVGTMPEFTLAPGFTQQREEPVAAASSQQSSQSEQSSKQPSDSSGAFENPEESPIDAAQAVMTVEDTQTISSDQATDGKNTSILLARAGSSLTVENCALNKTGDTLSIERTQAWGTNAALLAAPGSTVNVLGATIHATALAAPAVAVDGESATVSLADSQLATGMDWSPALLAVQGGQARSTGGAIRTEGSVSPAYQVESGSQIQADGASVAVNGPNSALVAGSGIFGASGLNGSMAQSPIADLAPGASLSLASSTLSSGGFLPDQNLSGHFIIRSDAQDLDHPALLNLESSRWTASPASSAVPSFFIRNASAQIALRDCEIPGAGGPIARVENGRMELNAARQVISGSISADAGSSLAITLSEGCQFYGTINADSQCPNVSLHLDASSGISLYGDLYLSDYSNDNAAQSNIYSNGYHIYVNGQAVY